MSGYLRFMRLTFFSTQPYDKVFFDRHNKDFGFDLTFHESQLDEQTAKLANGSDAVCIFVNDIANRAALTQLSAGGVKVIALRCAGFNNVDLTAVKDLGLLVVRVPAYSPQAVAEHAVALLLTLNRKTHKAYNRVREQNFSLNGLLGFDLYGKTIGVIGTGNIGQAFCRIMLGFGCRVLAVDLVENRELVRLGVQYRPLLEMLGESDVVSLHCPLNDQTRHLVNDQTIGTMKDGVFIINTSRGGLIDTTSVIRGLKSRKIGGLGVDVYEQEEKLFFRDLSGSIIEDDLIGRLVTFPNVLVTAHQGFFTREALNQIAHTTLANITAWLSGKPENAVV
jgi:D-lactate dehydrogenase